MTEYSLLCPTVFNTAKDPHGLYAEESEEPEVTLEQKMMGYRLGTCEQVSKWTSKFSSISIKLFHKTKFRIISVQVLLVLHLPTPSGFPPENLLSQVTGWPTGGHACFL